MIKYEKEVKKLQEEHHWYGEGNFIVLKIDNLRKSIDYLLSRQIEADNKRFREMIGEDEPLVHDGFMINSEAEPRNKLRHELLKKI